MFILTRKVGYGIIGFLLGSLIDFFSQNKSGGSERQNPETSGFDYYRERVTRFDFPTMLMALSAVVMKADGSVKRAELDYVKGFFTAQFGNQFTREHLQVLKHFLDNGQIPISDICNDIRNRISVDGRIQMVHYLFQVAKADGHVDDSEMKIIEQLANKLGIPAMEFDSVKNMFYRSADSDYKILGIEATASDEDVKRAYRKMAITFHPDKVAQMGEAYPENRQGREIGSR